MQAYVEGALASVVVAVVLVYDLMMLAMLVPIVIKKMLDGASQQSLGESLSSLAFFWSPYYTRGIEHKIVQTSWGGTFNQDRDLRNNVLIKAIQLYLDIINLFLYLLEILRMLQGGND